MASQFTAEIQVRLEESLDKAMRTIEGKEYACPRCRYREKSTLQICMDKGGDPTIMLSRPLEIHTSAVKVSSE